MAFMEMQVHKGDGWLVETDNGSVVLVDVDACDVDDLRGLIGTDKRATIGDLWGHVESVTYVRGWFGRYSAPGYMDCTDWQYDTNKRRLMQDLRAMYGDV